MSLLLVILSGVSVMGADEEAESFGSRIRTDTSLIGILYDLKQDQQRKPLSRVGYFKTLDDFLNKGWDEAVLNRFFRATAPLYTTQVYIPPLNADKAPKAFGVEKVVEPKMWLVHYKGQVIPPKSGSFRFVGYADDVIAAAVNGVTVLATGHPSVLERKALTWRSKEKPGMPAYNGDLGYGDWFQVLKDEPMDVDLILGENPGGNFCAFLFIQEKGVVYEMKEGHPVLPVFRVAEQEIHVPIPRGQNRRPWPAFAQGSPAWKALQ
ncbi:MAG: hypothetical protein HC904_06155 [Blastochloris sp.]|nr:hypothetical protein [Blastochloris sp.]